MIFKETRLQGAFIIEPEKEEDPRGFFARSWCQSEAAANGLNPRVAQCNISSNPRKGTLRGIHYQTAPFEEAKLVRCTSGSIFDVIVDLRRESLTFEQYFSCLLAAKTHAMLYVPEGFAHGFLTLEDNTEVFYQISEFYSREHALGIRWNDPAFGIAWPLIPRVMSERDRSYLDYCRRKS